MRETNVAEVIWCLFSVPLNSFYLDQVAAFGAKSYIPSYIKVQIAKFQFEPI